MRAIPEIAQGVFLFDAGNIYQLAEKIAYLNNLSKDVAFDLRLNNREVLFSKFDNERGIHNFLNFCHDIKSTPSSN